MIPKIKKILYATDLSENSAYAFRYAVNSAQQHGAKIHILHVLEEINTTFCGHISRWRSSRQSGRRGRMR